jgi:UDP-glucose 4-epimerase
MMEHHSLTPKNPARVVIIGAKGFIGAALHAKLQTLNMPMLALSSADIDLSLEAAHQQLASIIKPNDSLVILSAITPDKGRDVETMMRNLTIGLNICKALAHCPVQHTIYLSSDAVYSSEISEVTEETVAAPNDLYGIMHRAREIMFQSSVANESLAILRLTLTFGVSDTHNAYGPNRFRRSAHQDKKITLFGEGQEMRDHIFVDDVVSVIVASLQYRSRGLLNVATGQSFSFMEVAKKVALLFDYPVEISSVSAKTSVKNRHYDVTLLHKTFPHMQWTIIDRALLKVHQQMMEQS